MMAWRANFSSLRHDLRLVYVLLVWAAFAFTLFYVFSGSIKSQRVKHAPPPPAQARTQAEIDDEIYTGSIILVPPTGDQCWQMMIDNRDGRMWETGYVDCYVAVSELAENKRAGTISSKRIQSISNAFRGTGAGGN
jgi:hypothetical protein